MPDNASPSLSSRELLRNVGGALRLSWGASPRGFAVTTLLAVGAGLISPLVVWLTKRLVDLTVAGAGRGVRPAGLTATIVALGVLGAAGRVFIVLQGHRQSLFGERVEMYAVRRFLAQAASVDLGHFDNSDWHDRMQRAEEGLSFRPFQLTIGVTGLAGSMVTLVGMFGVILSLHPLLVALAMVSVIPTFTLGRRVNSRIYTFYQDTTPEVRERRYLQDLLHEPRLAKEIRAFGVGPHFLERHHQLDQARYLRQARLYRTADRTALLSGLISGVALVAAYAFVVARGVAGDLTAGDLAASLAAMTAINQQASLLASTLALLDQHARFLTDYFAFLEIAPLVPAPVRPAPVPSRFDRGLEVDAVSFTYPRGFEPALSGVSLRVAPGELLALVGDNGAGKTTLVKLLLRLYDPQAGGIRLGGVDLRELDGAELRRRIGVLFQDYAQYELTVRENVTLGRIERPVSDLAVVDALERAAASGVVADFPAGLDAKVGRLFDGGHDLSGGEWQRLALARLLYRDADLWILDEPTAALDPEAEATVFADLRRQLAGRMGIVISHRFSTVRVADRIAVLAGGRVIEEGTHDELIARAGRYRRLFELQAAGYR